MVKMQNSVALASMIARWSSWISAKAVPKLRPNATAATALPLGEVVVDPENTLLGDKGLGCIIEQLWRYSA